MEGLKEELLAVVRCDPVAADLKWSLFVTASQSYKHDSCLRPFPPRFHSNGYKDITALTAAIASVPPLSQLEAMIHSLPEDTVGLLHWVLLSQPNLTVLPKSEVRAVVGRANSVLSAPPPSLVVRLNYDSSSAAVSRWANISDGYDSLFAFHGSPLNNFHSILHYGLQQHLTKNTLYGQGVYLSSELLVSLPYSHTGHSWHHSRLGTQLSVVALCEVVNHPSVCCQAKGRTKAPDSEVGEVPHTLYLVPNSDLVRVSYLLVYASPPRPRAWLSGQLCGPLAWLGRHKLGAALFAYAALLASVGLSHSPSALRYWRLLCHALGFRY